MLDDLGGNQGPEPSRCAVVGAPSHANEKAGCEQVARAGGVDHPLDRAGRNCVGFLPSHHQTALLAARHDGCSRIVAQKIHGRVEIGRFVKAVQFALIGEDQVDGAGSNEMQELRALAVDAKRVREREGNIAP